MVRRRRVLAGLGTGLLGTIAGCNDGTSASPADGGTGEPAADDPQVTAPGGGSSGESASGAVEWRSQRGTPGATGRSGSGGPGTSASTRSIDLRGGFSPPGQRVPFVGADGVYAVATAAEPYSNDPVRFRAYAYGLSRDGTEQWRTTVVEHEGSDNIGAIRNVRGALGRDHVFLSLENGSSDPYTTRIFALSREDGSQQWSESIEGGGNGAPMVADGDTLYALPGSTLLSLSAADGSENWRATGVIYRQRHPVAANGAVAVFNDGVDGESTDRQLTVFDAGDGSVRWSEAIPRALLPTPTIAGDHVYVMEGDSMGRYNIQDGMPRRRLHALSLADGSTVWRHPYETDAMAEQWTAGGSSYVAVHGDTLYYALGFLDAMGIAGPQASEDTVEQIQEQGLYEGPNVFALNRQDGSVKWRTKVGHQAQVFQPPVVDDDYLYVHYQGVATRDEQPEIRVLDRQTGDVVGSYGPVEPDLAFSAGDGGLYVNHGESFAVWE